MIKDQIRTLRANNITFKPSGSYLLRLVKLDILKSNKPELAKSVQVSASTSAIKRSSETSFTSPKALRPTKKIGDYRQVKQSKSIINSHRRASEGNAIVASNPVAVKKAITRSPKASLASIHDRMVSSRSEGDIKK